MQPKVQAKKAQAHFHFGSVFFSSLKLKNFLTHYISFLFLCLNFKTPNEMEEKKNLHFSVMSFLSRRCSSFFFLFSSLFLLCQFVITRFVSLSIRQKKKKLFFFSLLIVTSFACSIVWRKLYNEIYFQSKSESILVKYNTCI